MTDTKRIRIIHPGVFNNQGERVPVGSEHNVPIGFKGWQGKYVEVSNGHGKTLEVATPKRPRKKRQPKQEQETEQPSLDTEAESDDND